METDFFDLGGDSLALLNLFAEVEARYGRYLTIETLAGGLTVGRLAQLLAGAEPAGVREERIVELQPHGEKSPFFCVHSIGGHVMNLRNLASHMPKDRPFLGLRWIRADGTDDSIERIAARYVDAMLDRQPAGPFYLGGYSMGAVIAYEMAEAIGRARPYDRPAGGDRHTLAQLARDLAQCASDRLRLGGQPAPLRPARGGSLRCREAARQVAPRLASRPAARGRAAVRPRRAARPGEAGRAVASVVSGACPRLQGL
ncbi:thioesterase domain-containing protein [Dankookia sp. P2]|uniref:thioesterase domain-containing protein n=1 Tax=Dankookia sp. P2 TaxID=3423955 RepID=UPI003D67C6BE